jgi:hypothetical protein
MRYAFTLVLALALSSCALTQKGEALSIRYFTPEHVRPQLTGADRPEKQKELRLGRVTSGVHLREPIAYRRGTFEIGYYDGLRWTERPELYVRRALTRTLFEEHAFERASDAPTLDVEIVSFEEVKTRELHAARIVTRIVLSTDRVILEDTMEVVEPVARDAPIEYFVAAMARALDAMSDRIAKRVGDALPTR